MRNQDVFEHKHLGDKLESFHEYDVKSFQAKFQEFGPKLASYHNCNSILTLKEAMRMNLGGAAQRGKIIQGLLEKKIPVIGVFGDGLHNILLSRKEIKNYLADN